MTIIGNKVKNFSILNEMYSGTSFLFRFISYFE